MRLATGLMIIGIVAVGLTAAGSVTALAQQAGSTGIAIQASAAVPTLTGSQMSVPATLVKWNGQNGYHGGWNHGRRWWRHNRHHGKWWWRHNRYCSWDPYNESWYCPWRDYY